MLPATPGPKWNIGQDGAYTTADFNDSQWRQLSLPHDWGIEGPFNPQAITGNSRQAPSTASAGIAGIWTFPLPMRARRFISTWTRWAVGANIWINGQYAGGWGYGYASFRINLTPFVKPGGQNVLAIRLDNPNNSSRWYPGGGIYRNVWLVKTSPIQRQSVGNVSDDTADRLRQRDGRFKSECR